MASVVQRVLGATISNAGTLVFGAGVTAGNHVVILGLHSYLGTPPTVATSGLTYTKRVDAANNGIRDDYFYVWTAPIPSSGATTITFSMGAGFMRIAAAVEVSGLDATTPYGGHNLSTNTTNNVVAGSITPTVNGSYIGALFRNSSGDLSAPVAPFTEQYDTAGQSYNDVIQTTAAAITPSATAAASPSTVEGFTAFFNASAATTFFRPYFITG